MKTIDKLTELVIIRNKIRECIELAASNDLSSGCGRQCLYDSITKLESAKDSLTDTINKLVTVNPNLYKDVL